MRGRWAGKALVVVAAVAATAMIAPAASAATGDIQSTAPATAFFDRVRCEGAKGQGDGAFYPGAAASDLYERVFSGGFALPHLDTHVPQGITSWANWDGKGANAVLVSMYSGLAEQRYSHLVAFEASSGRQIGSVRVGKGHLGGIAATSGWLFAQHDDNRAPKEPVRRYRLSALAKAFAEAKRSGAAPVVQRESGLQTIHGASFMAVYDGKVWSGHYNRSDVDLMYSYRADKAGKLVRTGPAYQVPPRTQGVLVAADRLVFNTSDDLKHGRMVVTRRQPTLETKGVRCFATPSMGENLARVGDRVVVLFEGGSYRYPGAVNRVYAVHQASFESLRGVLPQA